MYLREQCLQAAKENQSILKIEVVIELQQKIYIENKGCSCDNWLIFVQLFLILENLIIRLFLSTEHVLFGVVQCWENKIIYKNTYHYHKHIS